MGGYEKSPDYGSREPSPVGWLAIIAMLLMFTGGVFACHMSALPHA